MGNEIQVNQNTISRKQRLERDLAKFIKDKTGKGPRFTEVTLTGNLVVCYFDGYLTKAEEIVVQSGNQDTVLEYRNSYINRCTSEIEQILLHAVGKKIVHFFPSWIPKENLACWTIFLREA